jgi:parallel beta-helix repeat protein
MWFSRWHKITRRLSQTKKYWPQKPARPKHYQLQLEVLEGRCLLSTFLVTTTDDSGPGSLRQAILDANHEPGLNRIAFDIAPGGVQSIRPTSALPTVTNPVVIDGTSQPGFAVTPLIELCGSQAGFFANGLTITAGGSTVRGLVINSFWGSGIVLEACGGDVITGNYIGTDVTGTTALGNHTLGVSISSASNNTIGGIAPGAGNLISGNGGFGIGLFGGVLISGGATGNLVQGNLIGTDATGTAALGNIGTGVNIFHGSGNAVGGTAAGAGNLISGNMGTGVSIFFGATNNLVQGNYIGTDVTGTAALGNENGGVTVISASNNTIGGTANGAGNVISGNRSRFEVNRSDGVAITDGTGNLVQGNTIGTDVTGTVALNNSSSGVAVLSGSNNSIVCNVISGNTQDGVLLRGSSNRVQGNLIGIDGCGAALANGANGVFILGGSDNTIGGTAAGAANTIAFNNRDGVLVDGSTGNAIRRNVIFGNGQLGIELVNGGNLMQPAPVLTSAISEGGILTIRGTLTAAPGTTFTLEFFAAATSDNEHGGQAERFLASTTVTTDANGYASFEITLAVPVSVGEFVTATATDPGGNTSQFSPSTPVTGTNNHH